MANRPENVRPAPSIHRQVASHFHATRELLKDSCPNQQCRKPSTCCDMLKPTCGFKLLDGYCLRCVGTGHGITQCNEPWPTVNRTRYCQDCWTAKGGNQTEHGAVRIKDMPKEVRCSFKERAKMCLKVYYMKYVARESNEKFHEWLWRITKPPTHTYEYMQAIVNGCQVIRSETANQQRP